MALKNYMPPRRLGLKLLSSLLLLLLFENICLGGQWTMMFYMAADNDLYPQALTDIMELQRISGQPEIDILVQLDTPSGAFRYKVLPQGTATLAVLGASNSGSGKTLAEFGLWAVKTCPASKYLLVLWDHGDGWSKRGKFIGLDGGDYLQVAGGELRAALADIRSAAGQPLEVVVFDACSMQMAEVLAELNGLCRYAVGSEALFPVEGMPYAEAWREINGDTPGESLAARLVNSCRVFGGPGYNTTCSAIDIGLLSDAAQNLKTLTGCLRKLPLSTYVSPAGIGDSVLNFPPFSSYDLPLMLDFIGQRVPEPERTLALGAGQQFRKSILAQSITGSQYRSAQGLAAWYDPSVMNFGSLIDAYRTLTWSGLSDWDKLLHNLIFQYDSTAPVPQNLNLIQTPGGPGKLAWQDGYEPAGIEKHQIRHSQNLITDLDDRSGISDAANWEQAGFTIIPRENGDTAYFSIGGKMTGKNAIQLDSSGNIGFTAEGTWGTLTLESSPDTCLAWDTLGCWDFYREETPRYCSAKLKTCQAVLRLSWNTAHSGWVYLDNIKASRPDASREIETINTPFTFYGLSNQPGQAGFYQVRTIDSLQNQSPWSEAVFYQPATGDIRVWPNPFKGRIFLLLSSSTETERMQEVKIFNILGQRVDKMTWLKKAASGGEQENLYIWEPRASIADGIYIAQLDSDRGLRAVKMILIR